MIVDIDVFIKQFLKLKTQLLSSILKIYSSHVTYILNNKNCDKSRSQSPQKHHNLHKSCVYILIFLVNLKMFNHTEACWIDAGVNYNHVWLDLL